MSLYFDEKFQIQQAKEHTKNAQKKSKCNLGSYV
jgi:hypothetical protein